MASFSEIERFNVAALTVSLWLVSCASGCNGGAATTVSSGGQTTTTGGQPTSGGQIAAGGLLATGGSTGVGGMAIGGDSGAGSGGRDTIAHAGERETGGDTTGTAGGGSPAGGSTGSGGQPATGGSSAAGGSTSGNDAGAGTAGLDAGVSTGGVVVDAAGSGGANGGSDGSSSGGANSGSDGSSSSGGRLDGGAGGSSGSPYNPCPSTGACAILPLGDSITAGTGSSDGGGYRVELFKQAVANSQSITFVGTLSSGPATVSGKPFPKSHEGHSGFVIDTIPQRQGISSVTDAAIAKSIPHIVLLMIGTNDIPWNYDLANEPTRLGNLIDQITVDAPKALVVVAQIGPSNDDARTALIKAYNDGIPAVVQARVAAGKHVAMVDMFTPFVSNPNYKTALLSDEVHPNPAGYVILGQVWYAAIQSFLPRAH